ncbi:MAG: cytochrome c, partial [Pricia sp.]|nr:cytochrome c [Pricia sp.]
MNRFTKIGIVFGCLLLIMSCGEDPREPSIQYMPDMYVPVGYEAYSEVDFLLDNQEAMLPAENTIPRGWMPYPYENTIEGKESAREQRSPL